MNAIFSDVPEALSNTLEVLDKVEVYSIDHGPIMPFFPIPESFGTEEQLRERVSEEELYHEFTTDENGQNPLSPEEGQKVIDRLGGYDKIYRIKFEAEYLRYLAYEGAKKLYGDPLPANVDEHVNFELHVMKTMGFLATSSSCPTLSGCPRGVGCHGRSWPWFGGRFCRGLLLGHYQD